MSAKDASPFSSLVLLYMLYLICKLAPLIERQKTTPPLIFSDKEAFVGGKGYPKIVLSWSSE